jgi:hypothetical protein
MRIGLLGPAEADATLVRKAAEFLLDAAGAQQAIYLGADDGAELAYAYWSADVMGQNASDAARGSAHDHNEEHFLRRTLELSRAGAPAQIEELLKRDAAVHRLTALRRLPPPPARAVEMFEDKVVLFVHDKSMLDAEDIANAYLVVYGRSKAVALNHFGPRTFFSPGPLKLGQVAMLERDGEGNVVIVRLDFQSGEVLGRTALQGGGRTKMVVLS